MFGIVDGTEIPVAASSGSELLERLQYSGHKRTHTLSVQVSSTPTLRDSIRSDAAQVTVDLEGYVLHVSSAYPGSYNDRSVCQRQIDYMRLLHYDSMIGSTQDGAPLFLIGDQGYRGKSNRVIKTVIDMVAQVDWRRHPIYATVRRFIITRQLVEYVIGCCKMEWNIIRQRLDRHHNHCKQTAVIQLGFALYNFIRRRRGPLRPVSWYKFWRDRLLLQRP